MNAIEDAVRAEWADILLTLQSHPIGSAIVFGTMAVMFVVNFIFMRRRAGFWRSLFVSLLWALTFWTWPALLIPFVKARERRIKNSRGDGTGSLTDRF